MANLTGKAIRPFKHKGKDYKAGDEISLKPLVAGKYEKAGRISLTKTDVKTVDAANEKLAAKVEKTVTELPVIVSHDKAVAPKKAGKKK